MLELHSNNPQSLTFGQRGAQDGLHFLGSTRGVLPVGPDYIPAFDTLKSSLLSNLKIKEVISSYNYTLNHQGLAVNVSCSYDPICNVAVTALVLNSSVALQYQANCTQFGGSEVSADATPFRSDNSNSSLVYWPCQSARDGTQVPSHSIYMCGRNFYQTPIGNITCTVSTQTAIFPVMYRSTTGIFSTHEPRAFSPIAVSTIINDPLVGLGNIISGSQNSRANAIAEQVINFAFTFFGLSPYEPSPQIWRLFERMIQGMLEYEVCSVNSSHFIYLIIPQAAYTRLIYSTADRPSSCNRTVTGPLSYEVLGWSVTTANIGLLFPVTIINLAAFIVLLKAIITSKGGGYLFSPFCPRPVEYPKTIDQEELVPDEWMHKVMSQPKTVCCFDL